MIFVCALVLLISFYGFYFPEYVDEVSFIYFLNVVYFILSTLYLLKYRRSNLLCPELLIFTSYYFSSYLLIFANKLEFRDIYIFEGVALIRAISLATIGWIFFLSGALAAQRVRFCYNKTLNGTSLSRVNTIKHVLFVLLILFIAAYIYTDYSYLINKYNGVEGKVSDLFSYVVILILILSVFEFRRLNSFKCRTFRSFIRMVDKLYLFIVIFLFILVFSMFGNRSGAFQFMLPIVILYNIFISKIKSFYLVVIGVTIFIYSVFLAFYRDNQNFSITSLNQLSYLCIDFIPINAAIPTLINYVNNNGVAMGMNMIYQIFSVFPFAQSAMKYLFDIQSELSSSVINSIELLGVNYHSGQGTNVVGDLYYSFGILGVMCGMFLAGYIYVYMYNKILTGSFNTYFLLVFIVIFGNAIFFARVEFAFIFRTCSFVVIYAYLLNNILAKK